MTKPVSLFKTDREVIRLAEVMSLRFPLLLMNFEHLLLERGVEISYEPLDIYGIELARLSPWKSGEKRDKTLKS